MSLPTYPAYKDSGVAWLDEVPEHWEIKPLWTLFRRIKRTGYENEQLLSVYRDHGVVPKASRDDNNNKPSDDLTPYQLVKCGDLAINKMKAWQGSVAISEYQGIVSPAYFVYESINDEVPRFLHYLMRSPRYITGYLSLSKGIRVNQWDLEPQYHSRMPILVPPKEEQSVIANFLDLETTKIDELIAEQQRLIELLKEKRQVVISHAVTKGLNPDAPMKDSGIEWLGEVPEHWVHSRLAYVCNLIVDGTHHSPESHLDGDYRYVTAKNIKENGFDFSEITYLKADDHNEIYTRCPVHKGDVLYIKDGATAGIAMVNELDEEFSLLSSVALIRPKAKLLLSKYLVYHLNVSQFKSDALAKLLGGAMTRFTLDSISRFIVVLPTLDEQLAIVSFLNLETAKFDTLINETNRAIELLKERRTALISAAVTGKIDVRGLVADKLAVE